MSERASNITDESLHLCIWQIFIPPRLPLFPDVTEIYVSILTGVMLRFERAEGNYKAPIWTLIINIILCYEDAFVWFPA